MDPVPNADNKYSEQIDSLPGSTSETITETDLIRTINQRETKYKGFYKELKDESDKMKKYYVGDQVDETKLFAGEDPIVINRVLPSIETIIPMVAGNVPVPEITIRPSSLANKRLEGKLEGRIDQLMRNKHNKIKRLIRRSIRNLSTNKYLAWKVIWDEDCDDFIIKNLPAGKILFSKEATSKEELPFIIEYVTDTIGDLIKKFPEKEAYLRSLIGSGEITSEDSELHYIEYWENTFVAWKYQDTILGFQANPWYNWAEPDFNHIKYPSMPYMFGNIYDFGESIVDPTSMVRVVKSPQDGINKRKRQIDQNADMANGRYVYAGNKITKESAGNLPHNPKSGIYLDNADSTEGAVSILTGRAYDPGIYADMQDSKAEIDNILGVHAASRGQQDPSNTTVRGQLFLGNRDQARQSTPMEVMADILQDTYDFLVQGMVIYYDKEHEVDITDTDNYIWTAQDEIQYINREDLRGKKITVDVSYSPRDADSMKQEAKELASSKMMSLLDMYKILEYKNPEKMARNAIMEQVNPQYLYGQALQGESIDLQAVRDIRAIINNGTGAPLDLEYNVPDPALMSRYLNTLVMFIRGEEIYPDLPAFEELNEAAQSEIINHLDKERRITEALANQALLEQSAQQGPAAGAPTAQPPEGELPPEAAPVQPPVPQPQLAPA